MAVCGLCCNLPAVAAAYDGTAAFRHGFLLLLLLQEQRDVSLPAGIRHGQRLPHRPLDGPLPDAVEAQGMGDAELGGQSGTTGLLQVHQLLGRMLGSADRGYLHGIGHLSARGYLVLHLPIAELYPRCLPSSGQAAHLLAGLCVLRLLLPATGSRAYRSRPRLPAPDPTTAVRVARDVWTGCLPHLLRTIQEGSHLGLHQPELRRARVRPPHALFRLGKLVGCLWLCFTDLLRFLGL